MKPAPLGTILPHPAHIGRRLDAAFDQQRQDRESTASATLAGCRREVVAGETRWYASLSRFAVVNQSGRICWFDQREDGHWYASK